MSELSDAPEGPSPLTAMENSTGNDANVISAGFESASVMVLRGESSKKQVHSDGTNGKNDITTSDTTGNKKSLKRKFSADSGSIDKSYIGTQSGTAQTVGENISTSVLKFCKLDELCRLAPHSTKLYDVKLQEKMDGDDSAISSPIHLEDLASPTYDRETVTVSPFIFPATINNEFLHIISQTSTEICGSGFCYFQPTSSASVSPGSLFPLSAPQFNRETWKVQGPLLNKQLALPAPLKQGSDSTWVHQNFSHASASPHRSHRSARFEARLKKSMFLAMADGIFHRVHSLYSGTPKLRFYMQPREEAVARFNRITVYSTAKTRLLAIPDMESSSSSSSTNTTVQEARHLLPSPSSSPLAPTRSSSARYGDLPRRNPLLSLASTLNLGFSAPFINLTSPLAPPITKPPKSYSSKAKSANSKSSRLRNPFIERSLISGNDSGRNLFVLKKSRKKRANNLEKPSEAGGKSHIGDKQSGPYRKAAVWEFIGRTFVKAARQGGKPRHRKRFKIYVAGIVPIPGPSPLSRHVCTIKEEDGKLLRDGEAVGECGKVTDGMEVGRDFELFQG